MDDNTHENRIEVTRSRKPIIRVGFSNILIFLLIGSACFFSVILVDFSMPKFWVIFIIVIYCFLGVKYYSMSIASLQKTKNQELIIITAFSSSKFDLSEVKWIKTYFIPTSQLIFLLIKMKGAMFPNLYHLCAPQTNQGLYKETCTKLLSLLVMDSQEN